MLISAALEQSFRFLLSGCFGNVIPMTCERRQTAICGHSASAALWPSIPALWCANASEPEKNPLGRGCLESSFAEAFYPPHIVKQTVEAL